MPTMDYHKARNIPEVDFSGDGQIFVKDHDSTFPLRSRPKELNDGRNLTVHGPDDFDRIYNSKPKRYKKRQPLPREYAAEAAVIAGGVKGHQGNTTIASGTSSLGRKVREKKRRKYDLQRAFDSVRSSSSVDFGYMDYNSLGRSISSSRSLSSESMEKLQIRADSDSLSYRDEHIQLPYIPGSKVKPKRLVNEALPYVLFIITGVVLLILGLARLLLCWWHQYGSSLWTGTLVGVIYATTAIIKMLLNPVLLGLISRHFIFIRSKTIMQKLDSCQIILSSQLHVAKAENANDHFHNVIRSFASCKLWPCSALWLVSSESVKVKLKFSQCLIITDKISIIGMLIIHIKMNYGCIHYSRHTLC